MTAPPGTTCHFPPGCKLLGSQVLKKWLSYRDLSDLVEKGILAPCGQGQSQAYGLVGSLWETQSTNLSSASDNFC